MHPRFSPLHRGGSVFEGRVYPGFDQVYRTELGTLVMSFSRVSVARLSPRRRGGGLDKADKTRMS